MKTHHLLSLLLFSLLCSSCNNFESRWSSRIENASHRDIELILDSIHQMDQKYRQQLTPMMEKYGRDAKEVQELWKTIKYTDSLNIIVVKLILDKKGWLSEKEIGRIANDAIFLTIQHTKPEIQRELLPIMREAANNNRARKSALALLEDRVALGQGQKQIYGSQVGWDTENETYYVLPLISPDSVNFRRAKMGLGKLEYYVEPYGIKWDVEEYKRMLPLLEEKH